MKKILLISVLCLVNVIAFSQNISPQLISSAGDSYKNSSYQLDWSVGELQTETYNVGTHILTQGFQQGNYVITTIKQQSGLQLEITANPNPTSDFINLMIEGESSVKLEYQISDLYGRLLGKSFLATKEQSLDFSNFNAGTYILTIQKGSLLVKSFKIIKNQ